MTSFKAAVVQRKCVVKKCGSLRDLQCLAREHSLQRAYKPAQNTPQKRRRVHVKIISCIFHTDVICKTLLKYSPKGYQHHLSFLLSVLGTQCYKNFFINLYTLENNSHTSLPQNPLRLRCRQSLALLRLVRADGKQNAKLQNTVTEN